MFKLILKLVHGTLFLSHSIPWDFHETSNTKYVLSCACLMSSRRYLLKSRG